MKPKLKMKEKKLQKSMLLFNEFVIGKCEHPYNRNSSDSFYRKIRVEGHEQCPQKDN